MRTEIISNNELIGRAIAGTYVVMPTWDFSNDDQRKNLLGYAIDRTELKNGIPIEKYLLKGIKRFKNRILALPLGHLSKSEHPVQAFQ